MVAVLKGAAVYFLVVFGAGFVFGAARVLWLAPAIGARAAELIEMPLMLAVMVAAAARIVRWAHVPPALAPRLTMGVLALLLVLGADFVLFLRLRGLPLERYFQELDPVSGPLYYMLLAIFAALPLFFDLRQNGANGAARRIAVS
jgi:hypothetical protein